MKNQMERRAGWFAETGCMAVGTRQDSTATEERDLPRMDANARELCGLKRRVNGINGFLGSFRSGVVWNVEPGVAGEGGWVIRRGG